jgi:hypothetical protein
MKTQLCLLSGELMPNVIGVLHERPDRVVPVVTDQSASQVPHLANALLAADCGTKVVEPVTVLPYDMDDCRRSLEKVTGEHRENLTINWTGGTKFMSYAARRAAETTPGVRAIYVNTFDRQILIEDDPGAGSVRSELLDSAQLGLNALVHINAAGHTVERGNSLEEFRAAHSPPPELVAAAEAILDATDRERPELFRLGRADEKSYQPRTLSAQFLQKLQAASLIQPASQPGAVRLADQSAGRPFHRTTPQEENRKFILGGYLEVFLWSQFKSRCAFDDAAWHVVLNPGQKGGVTEFDVVIAAEGRLLVIEIKSRLEKPGQLADLVHSPVPG